ncbi:hypothetical protein [Xanthomonas arboricola]|uniref:hypothetical protein n=1 Tax=Xanthomonas arboricola TaxID=56448 RepID=UPI00179DFEFE|nr:hypothetical protein [Xanthomonas arboricola]
MQNSLIYVVFWLLVTTGCTWRFAQFGMDKPSGPSLCAEVLDWGSASASQALRMTPQIVEDENGRSYHFDLGGRKGPRYLAASCGIGVYAECSFDATCSNGHVLRFSELSTFSLWKSREEFYLVYHVVVPEGELEKGLRRVVKVDDPPSEICNQIGDYSNLM